MANKKRGKKQGLKNGLERRTRKDTGSRHSLAVRQTEAQEGLTHITRRLAIPLWISAIAGILMTLIAFWSVMLTIA